LKRLKNKQRMALPITTLPSYAENTNIMMILSKS
jgi:hypothetical protein